MCRKFFICTAFWLLPALLFAAGETYRPVTNITPPAPPREFRGAWIATVANIDWPSKPGLPVAQQKAELIALLDRAAQLKLNAVVFQVRTACDALYSSPFEPWSEYLNGLQGKAPAPFYDPLAFAIEECHKRGLELHAWFNPFRAAHPLGKSPAAQNHITQAHPELIRRYGAQTWLDPGEPAVRAFITRVVLDVVQRYDVDGVQFDDYFYPYPEKDSAGRQLEFPDEATWRRYGFPNGFDRDNWRRKNVNEFIQNIYMSIKAAKPWVKFGISPFGIWRPQNPPNVRGLDAYGKLYADAQLWLVNGWLDYCSPQLYWPVNAPQQSFPELLQWWAKQNARGRHLWPGLNAAGVGDKLSAGDISRQIQITRTQLGAGGEIFYHLRNLIQNGTLSGILNAAYQQTALIPATPWLDSIPPDKPKVTVTNDKTGASASWQNGGAEKVWKWVLQFQMNGVWTTEILLAGQTARDFPNALPDVIAVSAIDRTGNQSQPAVFKKISVPPRTGKKLMEAR